MVFEGLFSGPLTCIVSFLGIMKTKSRLSKKITRCAEIVYCHVRFEKGSSTLYLRIVNTMKKEYDGKYDDP